ncbi:MAG: hypothetical protein EOM23_03310, partial [Candidatus Moranbacteria bacterium]|nr:hypothetical protein [Candidatus Moranbacteria bacterium]
MTTVAAIFYGLAITLLLIVAGARPYRTTMSRFELERRAENGDEYAVSLLRREDLLHDIFSFQHALTALLLVTISALAVVIFHWTVGFM